MNPFIKVKGLTYCYDDNDNGKGCTQPTLKNLDLEINEGEFVAVLGHNGSGKSTFAKLLNMILVPTSGEIYVDGKNVSDPNMTDDEVLALRKNVGMVFQNPDNQLVATIVEDDVAFGPENLGISSQEIRQRVDNALKDVGMLEYSQHEPHRLSGGQKQRVAIAGVIAMMPRCIIFDESTAMLDPMGRKEVMNTIIRLNKEKKITVIMITHYMEEAAMADRIVVINDGNLVIDGTPNQIFERYDVLKSCGLNVPQCTELVHRLRSEGFTIEGDCVTVEQCADTLVAFLTKEERNV
ncbi:MAG: energy-coupling factor transporter ATPase [Ruminococcaceae bacterium]|nr:energy-coupling factor transporter ATPase [Oscillospiraceae bacterium]